SSRRRHTRFSRDWSSDVCSSDLSICRQISFEMSSGYPDALQWSKNLSWISSRCFLLLYLPDIILLRTSASARSSPPKWWPIFIRSEERRVGKGCRSRRGGQD